MVRPEFHRSGKEVRQQQSSLAQERLHFLYTPNTRENYHEASVHAHDRHFGIAVSGRGPVGWRGVRADRQGPRRHLDARFQRHRSTAGSKVRHFGPNPKGLLVFTDDGRFIYLLSRADLPKFASNNRTTGTPEENTAVVQGSVSTFGTYSLADKTLTIKVEHSTFPNWIGTDQQRTITITGDEMKWTNPAGSGGGVVELVLRRAK